MPDFLAGNIEEDMAALRAMLPQVTGCNIYLEEIWHRRFKGKYGGTMCGSKNFRDATTQQAAAAFVLRAIWHRHTSTTGQECPYELVD